MKDIIDFLVPSLKSFYSSFDVIVYQFTHEVFLEVKKSFLARSRFSSCISYFHLLRKIDKVEKRLDRGTDLTNALKFLKTLNLKSTNNKKQNVLVVFTDKSLGTDTDSINVAETIKSKFDIIVVFKTDSGESNISNSRFSPLTTNFVELKDENRFKLDLKNVLLPVCQSK